jgi:hypothetical protein
VACIEEHGPRIPRKLIYFEKTSLMVFTNLGSAASDSAALNLQK